MQYACRVTSSSKTSRDFARQGFEVEVLVRSRSQQKNDAGFAGTKALAIVHGENGFCFLG
jgi:hypothetical protein